MYYVILPYHVMLPWNVHVHTCQALQVLIHTHIHRQNKHTHTYTLTHKTNTLSCMHIYTNAVIYSHTVASPLSPHECHFQFILLLCLFHLFHGHIPMPNTCHMDICHGHIHRIIIFQPCSILCMIFK